MTKYEEVIYLDGDNADEFWNIVNSYGSMSNPSADICDTALEYVRQWDYGDDAPESLGREQVEQNLGIGWWSFEDDDGLVAYHWDHNWVHYFRKVNES